MKKLARVFVLVMGLTTIAWSSMAVEYDPQIIECSQNGSVVSYGTKCVIGYTVCVRNPCPKGTIE